MRAIYTAKQISHQLDDVNPYGSSRGWNEARIEHERRNDLVPMPWLDVDSCRGRGMAEERYMSNRGAFVRERIDIVVVFDVESRSPVA